MRHTQHDQGFGLVEVIVAMLLLAIIAVSLLPALWRGVQYSTLQSSTASATRLLNEAIEEARAGADCDAIFKLDDARDPAVADGYGGTLVVQFIPAGEQPDCVAGSGFARHRPSTGDFFPNRESAGVLASTTALVFVR